MLKRDFVEKVQFKKYEMYLCIMRIKYHFHK